MWQNIMDRISQPFINIGPMVPKLILGLIIGAIFIQIGLWLLKNVMKIGRIPKTLIDITLSLSAVILWIMLLGELAKTVGLSSIAITISGSLVVLGFALANGATALTSDIISAFFIAKDRDFNIGNYIKTGDVEGVVEKIDIRKVRIRGAENKLTIVPNTNLDKNGWTLIDKDGEDYLENHKTTEAKD